MSNDSADLSQPIRLYEHQASSYRHRERETVWKRLFESNGLMISLMSRKLAGAEMASEPQRR
jgi:hypothetical protein